MEEEKKPTEEEINITEKVLRYAANCNYIVYSISDALNTMQQTTYILKWNFEYGKWKRKED